MVFRCYELCRAGDDHPALAVGVAARCRKANSSRSPATNGRENEMALAMWLTGIVTEFESVDCRTIESVSDQESVAGRETEIGTELEMSIETETEQRRVCQSEVASHNGHGKTLPHGKGQTAALLRGPLRRNSTAAMTERASFKTIRLQNHAGRCRHRTPFDETMRPLRRLLHAIRAMTHLDSSLTCTLTALATSLSRRGK